ncbi:MAG TPA: exodeoxyribonuclease VII large subunit [Anaerolineae bacterium]
MLFTKEALTVSELTAHVKILLEADEELANVRVTGEISNLSRPASGHIYFTLKDSGSQVKCVMWKTTALRIRQRLANGDAVTVRGHIGVYERDGAYQLYIDSVVSTGTGDLYARYEQLKQSLEAEGLFDNARKRELPPFPRVLGIVTSPTGAALQDVLNVLTRRYPLIEVVLAPTLVQGDEAPEQIVRAIQRLDESRMCDVLLVTRGGGSLEELWAFNDERVVRAVAASKTPIVSGVGHEIDFTLTDFASDVRAPTPSAAAEIITPDIVEITQAVDALEQRANELLANRISDERSRLELLRRAMRLLTPTAQFIRTRERIDEVRTRLNSALFARISIQREQVVGMAGRLASVGPQATLARGYAIVRRERDHAVIHSVHDVQPNEKMLIRVSDGEFGAQGAA